MLITAEQSLIPAERGKTLVVSNRVILFIPTTSGHSSWFMDH